MGLRGWKGEDVRLCFVQIDGKIERDLGCNGRESVGKGTIFNGPRRVGHSRHHLEVLVTVVASPIQGKVGSFEEFFVRILPRDVELIKARFRELFNKHAMARNHLFLRETGVENKSIILRVVELGSISHVFKARHLDQERRTQSPPNIRRAVYMPTAATTLGLALKKRWSNKVTSVKNLLSVLV